MKRPIPSRNRQAGVGLLEVMIAVLIMAIGLLGIAALQAVTLKNTSSSAERTNAIIQTYSILDVVRANRPRASQYTFATKQCQANFQGSNGIAAGVVGDINAWINQLHQTVGTSACGLLQCTQTQCTVTVEWDESRATGGDAEAPEPVVTRTRL